MTDETRLHGMMADPGPAPTYDAHGWPADAPAEFRPGDRVVNTDGDWCTVAEPGTRVAVASDSPSTGTYWADPATLRHLDTRLNKPPTDSAGPALSSASTGGTGALAEVDALLERLEAATRALTTHTQTLRELLAPDQAKGGEQR